MVILEVIHFNNPLKNSNFVRMEGKKTNINFQVVDTRDPKYLYIADTSDWGFAEDKPAIIEITVPGFKNPVTHYFDKGSFSRYNSYLLGLNCRDCGTNEVNLPDGIYKIKVTASPSKYFKERNYLKTTTLQGELDKVLVSKVTSCNTIDDEVIKKLTEIDFLIRASEAHVRYGNDFEAQELFLRAQKLLKRVRSC